MAENDQKTLKRQGLYPCESEIARRLSQSEKRWRAIVPQLERDGLPKIDPLLGGRFWPAVLAYFHAHFVAAFLAHLTDTTTFPRASPSDAASSSRPTYDPGPMQADWRDEFWIALVGSLDAWLRSYYDIRDFTDDPQCVLRIGPMPAHMGVSLSDGTEIREGELVGALHLWNEHVPRYAGNGPTLAWAKEMRRRMLRSLSLLADFVECDPVWGPVRAFCGDSTLSSRVGGLQMQRLARRHGFEPVQPPATLSRHLQTIADSLIVWGLTRAFNPAALSRQRFLRDHNELWISRSMLVAMYGPSADRPAKSRST